jgi:O-antigen ligase/Tfp pilus assembly protein PilF
MLIAIIAISPWSRGSVGLESRFFIHIAALAGLLLWVINKRISSTKFTYYPAYLPLFCFLALSLASLLFSVYRYASLLENLNLLSYIIIFVLVLETANSERKKGFLVWSINIIGLFYCIYGILQYYGYLPKGYWAHQTSMASRFVNNSSFAVLINLNIFLCLGLALARKNILARLISLSFLTVYALSLILTKSRISWLIFGLGLVVFTFLALKRIRLASKKGFIFMLLFVILIGYILFRYKGLMWDRLYVAVPTQFQSLFQRTDVWKGTLRLIVANPFGTGAGSFAYAYPSYRTHSDRFFIDYAHNDYLQTAGDLGILGLIVLLWFLLRVLSRNLRALGPLSTERYFALLGLIFAGLSFIVQALVDFPLRIPANAVLFFATLGLLSGFAAKPLTLRLGGWLTAFIVSGIVASALLYGNIYRADRYYRIAEKEIQKYNFTQSLSYLDRSIKLMPINAEAYAARGNIYALKAALALGQKKEEYRKAAKLNLQKAASLDTLKASYRLGLARIYAEEGLKKEAVRSFNLAIERNPTDGLFYFQYGDYCLEHGLLKEGLSTYRKALSLFIGDDGRLVRLYGGMQALFDKIYGYTQDYGLLKTVVPDNKPEVRLEFAQFLENKNRASEARLEYKQILSKDPSYAAAKLGLERLGRE